MEYGRRLLRRFALDSGCTYLNHGSFGATPRTVLAEQDRWRARMERRCSSSTAGCTLASRRRHITNPPIVNYWRARCSNFRRLEHSAQEPRGREPMPLRGLL
jgi:hypothetical protein